MHFAEAIRGHQENRSLVLSIMKVAASCGDEVAVLHGLEVLQRHADGDKAVVLGWLPLDFGPPSEGLSMVALLTRGQAQTTDEAAIHIAAERGMNTDERWGVWGAREGFRAGLTFRVGPEAASFRFRDPEGFEALMDQGRVSLVRDEFSFPKAQGRVRDVRDVGNFALLRARRPDNTSRAFLAALPQGMTLADLADLHREAEPLFTEEHLHEIAQFTKGIHH